MANNTLILFLVLQRLFISNLGPSNAERLQDMEDRMNSTERKVAELEIEVGGTLPKGISIYS
jgi:hypothetical protein